MRMAGGPARFATWPLPASAAGVGHAGELVAARRPFGNGAAKLRYPFVARITPEIMDMRGDHRADEIRHAVLRLADPEVGRGLGRPGIADQLGKAHEWRPRIHAPTGRVSTLAFGTVH